MVWARTELLLPVVVLLIVEVVVLVFVWWVAVVQLLLGKEKVRMMMKASGSRPHPCSGRSFPVPF